MLLQDIKAIMASVVQMPMNVSCKRIIVPMKLYAITWTQVSSVHARMDLRGMVLNVQV